MKIYSSRTYRAIGAIVLAVSISFFIVVVQTFFSNLPLKENLILRNERLIGGDFLAFYVGGTMVLEGQIDNLYDLSIQRGVRDSILGDAVSAVDGELPFVYPPLIALVLSLFTSLPFAKAFYLWSLLGISCSLLSYFLFIKELQLSSLILRLLSFTILLGFIPFSMFTFLGGQLSWIGFCVLLLLYIFLKNGYDFAAGLILSLSYYKPPLLLILVLVLLLAGTKKLRIGFFLGALLFVVGSFYMVGLEGINKYISMVSHYTYGQTLTNGKTLPTDQGKGVYALLTEVLSSAKNAGVILAAMIVTSLGLLIKYKPTSRHGMHFDIWWSAVIVSTASLSVQFIKYDLALIFPALMLLIYHFDSIQARLRIPLLSLLIGMYFEWICNIIHLGDRSINLSSILLIMLIVVIFFQLKNQKSVHLYE